MALASSLGSARGSMAVSAAWPKRWCRKAATATATTTRSRAPVWTRASAAGGHDVGGAGGAGGNHAKKLGLFGLGWLSGGAKAYAARTAGHAGGNVFKGKSGGSRLPKSTPRKRIGGPRQHRLENNLHPEGALAASGTKALAKSGKGGKEMKLASVLPLLLFAGVLGYGIYSANNDKALINVGGGQKGYSVAQIQLGLLGSARLVQRDLDKIAMSADTNSRNGLYSLMQDSVIALIRSPEYWVYGNTQGKRTNSQDRCETYFNSFEMAERQKFEVETASNVQGKKGTREWTRPEKDWKTGGSYTDINELIVVTLIVALEEDLKLPRIESQEDMKIALNRLGSVRASSILAVELFWTPQDPDDVYTQEELITEYPDMQLI